jgi:UDP-N-acetylglucosamine 4-epimerase
MQLSTEQFEKISTSAFLVTGGAGFIGSHIAEFLLHAGARKVRVLDNLSTGHFRNIAPFINHPRFEFVKGDIREAETCKAACKNMDYVFHEAAIGSVPQSIKDPITTNNVNASGFINMLVAAHDAAVKRFVYASDPTVCGYNDELPRIAKSAAKPLSPYTVTKYITELYADVFARLYGMETIGLRYFNVFGQRQDPQSEYAADILKLVMQLLRHESPVINGMAEDSGDFTYVENVVDANILAVVTTDPNAVNQVYNIAIEERTSLLDLAIYLKEFLTAFDERIAGVEIIHRPARIRDMDYTPVSIEKAKKLLAYQPRYSVRNGLIKSAGWYWAYLQQFEAEAVFHTSPLST